MRARNLYAILALLLVLTLAAPAQLLQRKGVQISVVPYAPNIVRVTFGPFADKVAAAPGYGFTASPSNAGWKHETGPAGDRFTSAALTVDVGADQPPTPTINDLQLDPYFHYVNNPQVHLKIATAAGKQLVNLRSWGVNAPSDGDGSLWLENDRRPTDDKFYRASATFEAPEGELFYGLGQNQEGALNLRNHAVRCWHDYQAPGGESVCVPFLISSYGYGLVWDNPSRTTIEPGFNEFTKWTSEVGDRVSFFVISGSTADEIYEGYRLLTGPTPLLPKSAYGFTQSKQRYDTQQEVLDVAKGFRDRNLPADTIVVDFLTYTKMGQMDFDPAKWPDPAEMNRKLHAMGFHSLISVWPRFAFNSRYFKPLFDKGWFVRHADGSVYGQSPDNSLGPDIDTTNPAAAKWYWETIRDTYVKKGFDSIWLDETEPDVNPNGLYFHIGPGTQFYNVYPLFHTASVADGYRRDTNQRAMILSRASYLGAQRNGNIFWSSDTHSTWDMFRRSIPAGLNFTASGMAYWCSDTGGFFQVPGEHTPAHKPLIDPSDADPNTIFHNLDYPELYVRWFEWAAFEPIFRTHGTRATNEPWTYGKQAEPIIAKYLRLRYRLLPYVYSLAYRTYQTGAPYMRALWMDFPADLKASDLKDEYMFGPAFLVAPITEQGSTSREVYLPAGADWYNYWTNQKFAGGQTVKVDAPIDTIPVFVRAGSIVPVGSEILNTGQPQSIEKLAIYPGADADFTLYNDDGTTYAYEKGQSQITHLHWDNATRKLQTSGAKAWTGPDSTLIQILGN
jgi:alpha-D-xyloside xylohydrolase